MAHKAKDTPSEAEVAETVELGRGLKTMILGIIPGLLVVAIIASVSGYQRIGILEERQSADREQIKAHQALRGIHEERSARDDRVRVLMHEHYAAVIKPDADKRFDKLEAKLDSLVAQILALHKRK